MWKVVYKKLNQHRFLLFSGLYIWFISYAYIALKSVTALPATRWMNIFNFGPFAEWENLITYFRDLRTGVPPVLSALEAFSFHWSESYQWVIQDFYRLSIILMLVLPVFLTRRRMGELMGCLAAAWLFLEAVLIIAPMNPQLYDTVLPAFLLLYLLFSHLSFDPKRKNWLALLLAFFAGFFLSMAELSRPFILMLLPFLLIYNYYHYRKLSWVRFMVFLVPVLLISGGWHLKLLIYNQGQIVWSNHSGFNLSNAWAGLVDWDEIAPQFQPEAPPLEENPWTWENINTQIHYENSKIRQRAVRSGMVSQPGKALGRFWERVVIFTGPRTDMYEGNPKGPVISLYRAVVHVLFWILGFLLIRSVLMIYRDRTYVFGSEFAIIFITGFMCFMPIIGENGEEARFTLSVLSWLMLIGVIFGGLLSRIPTPKSFSRIQSGWISPRLSGRI